MRAMLEIIYGRRNGTAAFMRLPALPEWLAPAAAARGSELFSQAEIIFLDEFERPPMVAIPVYRKNVGHGKE